MSHRRLWRERNTRPRAIVFAVLVVALLSTAGVSILLWSGNRFLIVDEPPQKADVIIVLGSPALDNGMPGAIQKSRVKKGVELYHKGCAPVVIFTGAAVQNRFVEARVMADQAGRLGLPESALLLEPQATNTIENGRYSAQLMSERGWHKALVVTTPYHTRRATTVFSKLPLEAHLVAADLPSDFPWRRRLERILYEYAAIIYWEFAAVAD